MYTYEIRVERIVDGDTIDGVIDLGFDVSYRMRFRLAHLNTPETRSKDPEEVRRGNEAKLRLEALVFNRPATERVVMRSVKSPEPDKYGRWLANLVVECTDGTEIDVNQTLLDEGLATPYEGGKR